MTQTFGQLLVNNLLPKDLQTSGPMDKKVLHQTLYEYAKRDPSAAAHAMDQIRVLGHEIATTEGSSITLDDITPDYKTRDAILKPALAQLKRISDPEKRRPIIAAAQEKLLKAAKNFGGSQGLFVRSGARGKPVQLMRSYLSPVGPREPDGDTYPWMITKSHSEGLPPASMWAANTETRLNQIASNLAVTEPGDFAKILVNNMGDQLILKEDCGTTNGILMSTDDVNIIDRYLAKSADGFSAGSVITPQVYTQLKKKQKNVVVRSPMTCELNDGVCQKCYGKSEKGTLPTIGTNVGIRSAQAITEPLTQFALSAKHGVRQSVEDKAAVKGLKGLRQFLEIPKTFADRAVVSSVDGKVEKIEKAPQGGYTIRVADESHYVPPHLEPLVTKGQKLSAGDVMTSGVPMPNDVVQYKGMGAGRKYMVEQLHRAYTSQGADLDKRHFEVLARTHLNHVQIDEDPEDRFYPGEVVNYATMLKRLSEDVEQLPTGKAAGRVLAGGHLHHTAGTTVTPEIKDELVRAGIKTVTVAKTPPRVSFVMQPITSNPLLNPDWMARMGHRKLKTTLQEGAHFGQKSDIHSTHPVPGYAYGAEFGKGPGGRY